MFSSAKSFIPVSSGGKLPWYHKAERYTKITDHTSATNDHFPVKEIIRIVALENDANPWPVTFLNSLPVKKENITACRQRRPFPSSFSPGRISTSSATPI
ncbi:hypothetical protein HBH56_036440 [Parastagonospora nodorum]|uniref:Uncharacterized protein n=1 Tax=Phaeosphaeria nodorum (strain SN15 / ATCC MYA-4574 / FGSC 10173) TaxID=321614 RepID=A0A7U2I4Z4_PHANO|nr:hypothetical protein HBH56_036440 [Parastagonospora nodorum]QRD00022.1 hypothetical protein JI435_437820 [Parastagonospora nodorum SN15]KAH3934047.1 hypothetical protein HBH54_063030 [Parastagonospora nodorum]KAH3980348.1 hypothetical protein HBH52_094240 [Parastagonospora nodorum]KAH4075682.1 hypothetical protein HBH50_020020 [Parastagonospora nodorum]